MSLRTAAFLTPITVPFATSSGESSSGGTHPVRGCEQQVLVHTSGKVIFSFARCCSRSLPLSSKRNTEKARWSFARGRSGQKIWDSYLLSYPAQDMFGEETEKTLKRGEGSSSVSFDLCLVDRIPMMLSFMSRRMHWSLSIKSS